MAHLQCLPLLLVILAAVGLDRGSEAAYAPRCCDRSGNTFSSGSLFYQDPKTKCIVLRCIEGVAVWYKDFCRGSGVCYSSTGTELQPGETYWQPLPSTSSCQQLQCTSDGVLIQVQHVHCHDETTTHCPSGATADDKSWQNSADNITNSGATNSAFPKDRIAFDAACCDVLPSCTAICQPFLHCPEVLQPITVQRPDGTSETVNAVQLKRVSTCYLPSKPGTSTIDHQNSSSSSVEEPGRNGEHQLGVICPRSKVYENGADDLTHKRQGSHNHSGTMQTAQWYPTERHPDSDKQLASMETDHTDLTEPGRSVLLATPSESVAPNANLLEQLGQAARADGGRGLVKAQRKARCQLQRLPKIHQQLLRSGKMARPRSTTVISNLNFRTSFEGRRQGRESLQVVVTSQLLLSAAGHNSTATAKDSPYTCSNNNNNNTNATDQCDHCPKVTDRSSSASDDNTCRIETPPECEASARYRSADGTCNNLNQPLWGASRTRLRRLFEHTYADGIHSPTGDGNLPSARLVSNQVMDWTEHSSNYHTISVMSWGQFVDHDLGHTPINQFDDGSPIECCSPASEPPPTPPQHPACFPIEIASDDPFYSVYRQRCMNFVRSVTAQPIDCQPGPAEQLNDLTAWIDGSQIYGNSQSQQDSLRAFVGGKLLTSSGNLLPLEEPQQMTSTGYTTGCRGCVCFVAGDSRVNENPLLTLVHTVMMREHNRIADKIQTLRPAWSDELVFQETRRLIIAMLQCITMNEWIPTVLGYSFSEAVGLTRIPRPNEDPFTYTYLKNLNPNIASSFSTAAMRLHSLIQDWVVYAAEKNHSNKTQTNDTVSDSASFVDTSQPLSDLFFVPDALTSPHYFAATARGLVQQPPQRMDHNFGRAVRGLLFSTGGYGSDLVALNIQRGRDHGLAKYVVVLRWCTGVHVQQWSDLLAVMSAESVAKLITVYQHFEDIDLYTGISVERTAPGALVGPTTRCLLAEQFLRLRYADRCFYDRHGQPCGFSTGQQLHQLQAATSWAALLCRNVGNGFTHVQWYAFYQQLDFFNPQVQCDEFQDIDVSIFLPQ